jgi:hypothetical protein
MSRGTALLLLVAGALSSAPVHAQRGGSPRFGTGGREAHGRGVPAGSFVSRRAPVRQNRNTGFGYFPVWYDGAYPETQPEPATAAIIPPVTVAIRSEEPPRPPAPAAKPLLVDLPGDDHAATTKPLPAAIFILANGERLETRRYMLTADALYVTIDRQQRTLKFSALDLERTMAANRDRGVKLRIPADRGEISLGF